MLIVWDPEDGSEKQQWMFDPEDVSRKRSEQIEATFGGTYDEWKLGLQKGGIKARTVLLWYMLSTIHPKLQYKDIPDFKIRQLKVEQTVAELKVLLKQVDRMDLDDTERQQFMHAFRISIEDAAAREGIEVDITEVDGQMAIEGDVVVAYGDPKEAV